MSNVNIPAEWSSLCESSSKHTIHECINGVFRRLLANLLLDFSNPKFRKVNKENKALLRATEALPSEFICFLFSSMGFADTDDCYTFAGTEEDLKHGDAVFSRLETIIDSGSQADAERNLQQLKILAAKKAGNATSAASPVPTASTVLAAPSNRPREPTAASATLTDAQKDRDEGELVRDIVRKTLLNTGRIRNAFFEAKDVTIRTMRHGRVYACSEKCGNECIEVHWHLLTGRNILYSHLAHLSADGTQLLHLGVEHGYQYNALPGSPHFGKMIHFSEKLTDEHGKLISIKHDDKPVASCIYCGRPFSELLL